MGKAVGISTVTMAQVMGHAPSAPPDGCRPRSLDTLSPHLERIEAHLLELADTAFDAKAKTGTARVTNPNFVNQGLTVYDSHIPA